jgi:hypothetical protein
MILFIIGHSPKRKKHANVHTEDTSKRELRPTGCIVDDKRDSLLMYVKEASTLNEGQNVSFIIVPRLLKEALEMRVAMVRFEQTRAQMECPLCDAMPLIMVNRVLILSISLPSYQRRAPSVG